MKSNAVPKYEEPSTPLEVYLDESARRLLFLASSTDNVDLNNGGNHNTSSFTIACEASDYFLITDATLWKTGQTWQSSSDGFLAGNTFLISVLEYQTCENA